MIGASVRIRLLLPQLHHSPVGVRASDRDGSISSDAQTLGDPRIKRLDAGCTVHETGTASRCHRPHIHGRSLVLGCLALLVPLTIFAATAWACGPSWLLTVTPTKGPPGTQMTVKGTGFAVGQEVIISGSGGFSATVTPADYTGFSIAMTMPDVPPGVYIVTAEIPPDPGAPPAVVARVAIQVTGPPAPPPSPVADVSPGPTQLVTPETATSSSAATFGGASRDGRRVWFGSPLPMTNDDFTGSDYNLFERADGVTRWLSGPVLAANTNHTFITAHFSAASKDGSRVFFVSNGRLTSQDNDSALDVYERSGGVIKLISKAAAPGFEWTDAEFGGISEDGRRVFFSTPGQLTGDDDDGVRWDVYEYADGVTRLVSVPLGAEIHYGDGARFAAASADGSRVFFRTYDQLTGDDTDGGLDDVYERAGGVTTLVTRGNDAPGANNAQIQFAGVSRDGSRVFFHTQAKMTDDDEDSGRQDVYERSGGITKLVSKPTGVADPATGGARLEAISDDGSRVFFTSEQELTPDDDDTVYTDVYERAGGVTTLISKPSQSGLITPAQSVWFGAITGDGRHVYFETTETMAADDTDTLRCDVFERSEGKTTLISKESGLADPDDGAGADFGGVSDDGSVVFFETDERLVAGDEDDGKKDVYRRASGVTTLISRASDVPDPATRGAWFLGASAGGSIVFFGSEGRYTQDDLDQWSDIYSVGVPDVAADELPGPGAGEPPVEGPRAGPPPASPDTTPPRLMALRLSPQRLRVTRRGRIAPGASTQISFRLSEAAVVTLTFERAVSGRRGDGRCESPAPRNRAGAPCRRYVRIAGSISRRVQAGTARIRFSGRIGRAGALKPGTYRVVAIAVDDAGNRSAKRRASLSVLAAPGRS